MLHNTLPFFWADMSIYPGNSGGPVVANDRLVGIVVPKRGFFLTNFAMSVCGFLSVASSRQALFWHFRNRKSRRIAVSEEMVSGMNRDCVILIASSECVRPAS